MDSVLFALWFFAPVGFANAAPVILNNISYLRNFTAPMDFGKSFRGKRIFGDHKTFRGLAAGIVMGLLVVAVQMWLFSSFEWAKTVADPIDYSRSVVLLMGASMGAGALVGDAVKSFFKRQAGVRPGANWVPFDQTDFIVGALIFAVPFASLSPSTYLTIFVVMALLHPVVNLLGWLLHLKDKPF